MIDVSHQAVVTSECITSPYPWAQNATVTRTSCIRTWSSNQNPISSPVSRLLRLLCLHFASGRPLLALLMEHRVQSRPVPSFKVQRHGRERDRQHNHQHNHKHDYKHDCWAGWPLDHQADDYELRLFVKELENSFDRRTSSPLPTWSHLLTKARSCRRREKHHVSLQARESLHEELRLHLRLDDSTAQARRRDRRCRSYRRRASRSYTL